MESGLLVGIDLGGTGIKAGVVTPEGEVLGRQTIATPEQGPEAGLEAMTQAARQAILASGLNERRIRSVGVGAPGVLDGKTGVLREAANLDGWNQVPVTGFLSRALDLPVRLINDANAAALGELRFGVGRGETDLILLTLGTGVGGGLVLGGKVVEGRAGLAGEFGHMRIEMSRPRPCGCGKFGCLEAYVGAKHLLRRMHEALADDIEEASILHEKAKNRAGLPGGGLTVEDLFRAANDGDGVMGRIVDETAMALAVGIANLVHALDPPLVVLAGGVAQAVGFREKVEEFLPDFVLPAYLPHLRLLTSGLGTDAGILGAAAAAETLAN